MKSFSVTKQIRADQESIWQILTDAPNYTTWNTTVDSVEGRIAPGESVTVRVKINPGKAFPVKVTEFTPSRRMVWSGGMPLGLFKGERTFELKPKGGGVVEFSMREEYTGLLAGLIGRSIPDLQPAFEEFGEALKKHAEGRAKTKASP